MIAEPPFEVGRSQLSVIVEPLSEAEEIFGIDGTTNGVGYSVVTASREDPIWLMAFTRSVYCAPPTRSLKVVESVDASRSRQTAPMQARYPVTG